MTIKKILFTLTILITLISSKGFCEEGPYRISVLSEQIPKDVDLFFHDDEPLTLAIDEEQFTEYTITGNEHFNVSLDNDKVKVTQVSGTGASLREMTIEKNSTISFITASTRKTYNDYTVLVNKSKKAHYQGVIHVSKLGRSLLILLYAKRLQVLAEIMEPETAIINSDEALKAQAVLTRTLINSKLDSHAMGRYDLCDMEHCSTYKNRGEATKRALEALIATEDKILVYDNHPVSPHFFNTCGGRTSLMSTSWGVNDSLAPHIKSVKCDYCVDSKNYRYKKRFNRQTLSQIFLGSDDKGFNVKVTKYDKNKHWIDTVEISSSTYKYTMKGNKFMRLVSNSMGMDALPSGAFSIKKKGDVFI
ncbi:SpoIID/LytB domain-containing protein, partial [Thermodesulfobacteriota bacterium]